MAVTRQWNGVNLRYVIYDMLVFVLNFVTRVNVTGATSGAGITQYSGAH